MEFTDNNFEFRITRMGLAAPRITRIREISGAKRIREIQNIFYGIY